MNNVKFNIDDRVVTIEGSEIRRGTIKKLFDEIGIGFVEFDDGEELEKVILVDIALEPKPDPIPETEESVDPLKVNISMVDFIDMAIKTIIEFTDDVATSLTLNAFAMKLNEKMFTGVDDD